MSTDTSQSHVVDNLKGEFFGKPESRRLAPKLRSAVCAGRQTLRRLARQRRRAARGRRRWPASALCSPFMRVRVHAASIAKGSFSGATDRLLAVLADARSA